jgi:hypothetical protein
MKTHYKRLPKHVLQMSLYILRHQTGIAKYLKRFAKNFAQKNVDCLGNPHISPRTLCTLYIPRPT